MRCPTPVAPFQSLDCFSLLGGNVTRILGREWPQIPHRGLPNPKGQTLCYMNCPLLLVSKGEWAKKPPLSFTDNPTTLVEHTHNLLLLLCRDTSLNRNRTWHWSFVSSIERETEDGDNPRYIFSREVQNDAQDFLDF